MMEAARTSETSVDNYFTRQYIPEDNSELHIRRRENLKSHTNIIIFLQLCKLVMLITAEFRTEHSSRKRFLLGKLVVDNLLKNSPSFMVHESWYSVNKTSPLIHIPSQLNPIRTLTISLKFRLDTILLSKPRWGLLTKILYTFLISLIHNVCPDRPILLVLITLIIFGEKYKLLSSCFLLPFRSKYFPLHPVLK
jgi:hypothetical protein